MEGSVQLSRQLFSYRFESSPRGRFLRLMLNDEGIVVVRARKFPGHGEMIRLLKRHESWIQRAREKMEARTKVELNEPFSLLKAKTQIMIRERVDYWNRQLNCEFRGIMVRRGQSRWGSCSKTGMLSFNYRLCVLPVELVDYVVVHELCHLKEFNHSPRFWGHVEAYISDWKQRRRTLRKIRFV